MELKSNHEMELARHIQIEKQFGLKTTYLDSSKMSLMWKAEQDWAFALDESRMNINWILIWKQKIKAKITKA